MDKTLVERLEALRNNVAVPELYVADWTGTYFVRLGEQWFRVYPQKMLTPQEFGELGSAPDFSIDGELPPEVLAELSKDARAEYAEAKSHRPPFSTQAESAARAVRRLRSSKGYLPLRERNHIAKLIESMAAAPHAGPGERIMSENVLAGYMVGRLMAFNNRESADAAIDDQIIVEAVELTQQTVELAFDVPGSKRRMYLTLPRSALLAALDQEPTP